MQDTFFAKSEELEKDLLNFLRGVIHIPSYSGDEGNIHDAETMAIEKYLFMLLNLLFTCIHTINKIEEKRI